MKALLNRIAIKTIVFVSLAMAILASAPHRLHGQTSPAKRSQSSEATTPEANSPEVHEAEYDENKRVTFSGTVTEFEWVNPHAWLSVEGKDESGKVIHWAFEMGSPGGLLHRGWVRTAVKKGDQVTVEGFCARDGRKVANAGTVTLADGRKLFGGFQSTPGAPKK